MTCKGVCTRPEYRSPVKKFRRWDSRTGTVVDMREKYPDLCRCTVCDEYLILKGETCPCCHYRVSRRVSGSAPAGRQGDAPAAPSRVGA